MKMLVLRRSTVLVLFTGLLSLGAGAPPAERDRHLPLDLSALSWLEGHWRASAWGGIVEEVWLPAAGNSMHALFRSTAEGSLQFSEFIQVTAEKGGVIMRFNHFRPDYTTWEGDGPPMELILTEAGPSELVFEAHNEHSPSRIAYRRIEGALHVTVTGVDGVIVFHRVE